LEVLNVKGGKERKEKLERLVKARGCKNKSEAVREIMEEHFEGHPEFFAGDELEEIVKEGGKMSDAGFDRLAAEIFRGPRSAAELVGEEGEDEEYEAILHGYKRLHIGTQT